jgi:hypothetical protein
MNTNIVLFLLLGIAGIIEALPAPQGTGDRSFEFISAIETIQTPSTTESTPISTDPPIFAATVGPSPPGMTPFPDPESDASLPGSTYTPTSGRGPESTHSGKAPRLDVGGIVCLAVGFLAVVLLGVFAVVASRRKRRAKKTAEATCVVGITTAPEACGIRPPPPSYQEAVAGRQETCEVNSGCVGGVR